MLLLDNMVFVNHIFKQRKYTSLPAKNYTDSTHLLIIPKTFAGPSLRPGVNLYICGRLSKGNATRAYH